MVNARIDYLGFLLCLLKIRQEEYHRSNFQKLSRCAEHRRFMLRTWDWEEHSLSANQNRKFEVYSNWKSSQNPESLVD